MELSIDDILREIGEFGKFQWILLGLCGYIACTLGAFGVLIVGFITAEPEWICVEGYNSSICNFTEPISLTSKHYKARCDMPREAWTYVDSFTSTVTEYDLVCGKSILQSVAQSCFWVGTIVGLVSGGYLADRSGRRKLLYIGCLLVTVATWIMVFPKTFILFIVCRIFIGLGSGFRFGVAFVLASEYTTEKYRAKLGLGTFYFWGLGSIILPLMAYLIRDWRMLLLATAVSFIPLLFFWWFLPESMRWQMAVGKKDEARKQLEKVAKINGKPFPDAEIKETKVAGEEGNFKHLFFNRRISVITLIGWNLWFTIGLVYYGISFGSVDLGGNRYLNFALTNFVDLPSNLAAIEALGRIGRKKTVLIALVVACIASVISVSIPSDRSNAGYNGGRIFVALVAKFFINMAFSGIYLWSSELFPTFVRSMGLSTSSAAARVGSFAASYVIWLIRIHPLLPYGLMALFCLQAAILVCFLPETKGKPTMENLEDMVKRSTVKENLVVKSKEEQNANTQL